MKAILLLAMGLVLSIGSNADAGIFFKGKCSKSGSCSATTAASNGSGFTSVNAGGCTTGCSGVTTPAGYTVKMLADGRTVLCNETGCQIVPAGASVPSPVAARQPETITIDGRQYRLVPVVP